VRIAVIEASITASAAVPTPKSTMLVGVVQL
jgi:hypothetical protein